MYKFQRLMKNRKMNYAFVIQTMITDNVMMKEGYDKLKDKSDLNLTKSKKLTEIDSSFSFIIK